MKDSNILAQTIIKFHSFSSTSNCLVWLIRAWALFIFACNKVAESQLYIPHQKHVETCDFFIFNFFDHKWLAEFFPKFCPTKSRTNWYRVFKYSIHIPYLEILSTKTKIYKSWVDLRSTPPPILGSGFQIYNTFLFLDRVPLNLIRNLRHLNDDWWMSHFKFWQSLLYKST